jgi:hypothetical protein
MTVDHITLEEQADARCESFAESFRPIAVDVRDDIPPACWFRDEVGDRTDIHHIWTILEVSEAKDGTEIFEQWAKPGFCRVNAAAKIITEVPWEEGQACIQIGYWVVDDTRDELTEVDL